MILESLIPATSFSENGQIYAMEFLRSWNNFCTRGSESSKKAMKYWYDHLDYEIDNESKYSMKGLSYIEDEYLWCYTTTGELSHRGRRMKNECMAAQLG